MVTWDCSGLEFPLVYRLFCKAILLFCALFFTSQALLGVVMSIHSMGRMISCDFFYFYNNIIPTVSFAEVVDTVAID